MKPSSADSALSRRKYRCVMSHRPRSVAVRPASGSRLLLILIGAALGPVARSQGSPPDPTVVVFNPTSGQTATVQGKTFTSSGYQIGTVCMRAGSEFACGAVKSFPAGTTVPLNSSLASPPGIQSAWAAGTYTFTQSYTFTAGQCERCQVYVCFPNSLVQHWAATRLPLGYSWNNSVDVFLPGGPASVAASCVGDLSCPGCNPPAIGASLTFSSPGSSNSVRVLVIDLSQFFNILSGSPPSGHPILNPHTLFSQLNDWQRCEIAGTLWYIQAASGLNFTHLFVIDAAAANVFDLALGLNICPCVTIALPAAGPGSVQFDQTPCPQLAGAPYFLAITLTQGAFPNGWFFGLDVGMSEIFALFSAGPPFTGVLNAVGAATLGPAMGLPSGLTFYTVMTHWTPGYTALVSARPAVAYTVP